MRERRTPGRQSAIAGRTNVRYVKFTPEEMAYDAPADASDPKRFPTLACGRAEWEQFLSFKRGYARIDADLRGLFKDDRAVNDALRRWLEVKHLAAGKRRKTA